MDCGSFSQDIIKMVHGYCNKFYIRASRCESLYQNMMDITDWKTEEINFESYQIASIPFTSFLEEEHYRLVIQRQKRKDRQSDLFEGEYTYRCIVTNDQDSTEKEIITFYNARGASERTFDMMNNDFGWKHFPLTMGERGKCEVIESSGTKKTIKNKIKGGITKLKSAKENHIKCCGF